VQIVNGVNEPFTWWLLVDGQSLGDRQSFYTVILPEGNHVLELPPCPPGGTYKSHIWQDINGNTLGEETALSLNLMSDQQITLLLEFNFWVPSPPWPLYFIMGVGILGLGYIAWYAIKKHHK
jgi:hypothetical protein